MLVNGIPVIKNGEHTAAAYVRQVLDCVSPLALWGGVDDVAWPGKSGRGLPHFKTLRVPLQFNAAADFCNVRVLTATSVSCASSQSRTGCTRAIFKPRPVPPVPGGGLRRLHFRHGGYPPAALRLLDKVLLSLLCAPDAQAAFLIGCN